MLKKVKVLVAVLLIVLLSLVAFCGVFTKEKGIWNNIIPNYKLGMDLAGVRQLRYIVDPEEKEKYVYIDENGNIKGEVWKDGSVTTAEKENEASEEDKQAEELQYSKETRTIKSNPDEKLTKENFELAKKIIQQRLKAQKISGYDIRIDDVTGQLVIETGNDNDTVDKVEDIVSTVGKFQIIDYQNGVVLMDNSDIKNVSVVTSNNSGYNTYLQIEFNKAGGEKLKEISNKYVETKLEKNDEDTTQNVDEEGNIIVEADEQSDDTEKKYVSIVFDETTMMTTYFGEEMTNGILQISIGSQESEYDQFIKNYNTAQAICDNLNSGVMPIDYELETDNFVNSLINEKDLNKIKIISIIIVAMISLVFCIKFGKNGIIASILGIGYIAVISLVIRYTNATVSSGAVIAYVIVIAINYVFMKMLIENKNSNYLNIALEFCLNLIPLCVIAVIFTLMTAYGVSSIGMAFFWGIVLNVLYNFIFSRTLLNNRKD